MAICLGEYPKLVMCDILRCYFHFSGMDGLGEIPL